MPLAQLRPLAGHLEQTATTYAGRTGMVDGTRRYTWEEIRERSVALAAQLASLGVRHGDRVGLWLPNQAEWLFAWAATSYLGAIVVPVSTRFKADEVSYILGQSGAKALIMRPGFLSHDYVSTLEEALFEPGTRVRRPQLDGLEHILCIADHPAPFVRALADVPIPQDAAAIALQTLEHVAVGDETILVYTSGTTGSPKGVVHSSESALRQTLAFNAWIRVGPDSCLLAQMPFFHIGGSFNGIVSAIQTGARLVVMDRWDADEALDVIAAEAVTHLMGTPTHYLDFVRAQRARPRAVESLGYGWMGGAHTPREVIDDAIDGLGLGGLVCCYGLTEAPNLAYSRPDDPRDLVYQGKVRPLSPEYDLVTRNPETDEDCPPGVEGEIRIKGYPVMKGYFRMPDATAGAFDAGGYLRTGDLGRFDEDGYLSITGRLKDMYIVGGANAYPAEIESVIMSYPGVRQAQVVGVPHPRLGEVGCAFVEADDGASIDPDDIVGYCRERLANYKVPSAVHLTSDWPLTPTGKIQKFRLRERAQELETSRRATMEATA